MKLFQRKDKQDSQVLPTDACICFGWCLTRNKIKNGFYLLLISPIWQKKSYLDYLTYEMIEGKCRGTILISRRISAKGKKNWQVATAWLPARRH